MWSFLVVPRVKNIYGNFCGSDSQPPNGSHLSSTTTSSLVPSILQPRFHHSHLFLMHFCKEFCHLVQSKLSCTHQSFDNWISGSFLDEGKYLDKLSAAQLRALIANSLGFIWKHKQQSLCNPISNLSPSLKELALTNYSSLSKKVSVGRHGNVHLENVVDFSPKSCFTFKLW